MHWRGALSGRQRRSFVPCLKRPPLTWSKRTSTTSLGLIGCHSFDRARDQRLWPPGVSPVKLDGARRCSSFCVNAATSALASDEVNPTWCRSPVSSYRPSNSEPTTGAELAYLKPPTTQSAVRKRLTLSIARSPGRYSKSNLLATIPSVSCRPSRSQRPAVACITCDGNGRTVE